MPMSFIYVTSESREEARLIVETLINERLVACGNILGDIESIYRWNDTIERQTEVALILKTEGSLAAAAISRIEELHSYDTPCAAAIAVNEAPSAFLNWISEETGSSTTT